MLQKMKQKMQKEQKLETKTKRMAYFHLHSDRLPLKQNKNENIFM